MRVLVLGASGLAGSAIFHQLEKHDDVFGTYFSSTHDSLDLGKYFQLELANTLQLDNILHKTEPEVVVSCLRGDFKNQIELHRHVGEYLAHKENGTLIFLSTTNVFDKDGTKEHYEQDNRSSCSDYGNFKIACEDLLMSLLGNRLVILRVPFIWGKTSPRFQQITEALAQGTPIPVWSNLRKNHTTDRQIAHYVDWIVENHKTGVFHVGSDDIVDYTDFIERLVAALGRTSPMYHTEQLPQPCCMAVVTARSDIPESLKITTQDIISFLTSDS